MAHLGITGVMKTVPRAATEVLLGLPLLHLQLEADARAGIYSLSCSDKWKPKSEGFGHAYMTQGMKEEPILQMGTDGMMPRHVCDKPFTVRFPDRSEWKGRFQPIRKGGLIWYTEGPRPIRVLGLGCMVMAIGRSLASAVANTPQYSRQKCMPLRLRQSRI
jgi:hypothetical protein